MNDMNQDDQYSLQEKKELLLLARKAIEGYLETREKDYPTTGNPRFLEKRGVFVTLHKKGDLRGCIGYPLPIKPLWEAVVDNAISSATEDHRFSPVSTSELKDIDIELSVLTVPRKIKSVQEVVVGRDGIIISKSFMKGLLLPQVPVEQRWDLEQYISWGCRKAGLPPDEWKKGVDIEIFQAVVFGENEAE